MPTPQELLAEIQSGPLAATLAPLVSAGNDAGVAIALNDPAGPAAGTVRVGITPGTFSEFLSNSLVRFKLADALRNTTLSATLVNTFAGLGSVPGTVGDWVEMVLGIERNPHLSVVDPTDAQQAVSVLVGCGVCDSGDAAAFVAATTRAASRAEVLWGVRVTADDVSAALKPLRG